MLAMLTGMVVGLGGDAVAHKVLGVGGFSKTLIGYLVAMASVRFALENPLARLAVVASGPAHRERLIGLTGSRSHAEDWQPAALPVQARSNTPQPAFSESRPSPSSSGRNRILLAHAGLWLAGMAGIGYGTRTGGHRGRPRDNSPISGRERSPLPSSRQLTAFHRISEIMQAEDVGPNTFNTIAREISQMSGFPIVTIELCDFERAMMSIRGSHGFLPGDLPTPFEMPMDVTFSGEVAQTGKTLVETQASTRREFATPFLRELKVEVFICAPILLWMTCTAANPNTSFTWVWQSSPQAWGLTGWWGFTSMSMTSRMLTGRLISA